MERRKVEVFTAGCPVCEPLVRTVKFIACPDCDVSVHNIHEKGAEKALQYGVKVLPAVVIDGSPVNCCGYPGLTENDLRGAGLGEPLY